MADTEKRCPTCNRLLDPLRAPKARIIGGRVVSFCSTDCAAGRQSAPPLPPPPSEAEIEVEAAPPVARAATPPTPSDITPPPPAPPEIAPAPRALVVPELPVARAPSRRPWIAMAVIAVAAVAAIPLLRTREAPPPAPPAPPMMVSFTPPPLPVPVPLTRAELVVEARRLLGKELADGSPRVRRLAALAFSRAKDPAALDELRRAVEKDESEIRRLEAAYGLARAGDSAGADFLATGLRSSRRDVRLESARALARLGDQRGRDRLREAFSVSQLRLGAAENLAALGDEEGRQALRDAMAGDVAETRMRAAVALGRLGDPMAAPVLREIVGAAQVEVGAADALARLGDRDVIPALARALGSSALRVEAAISLRRLGTDVDLTPLAAALGAEDEVGKISAAEALLVLLLAEPPAELR